MDFEPATRGQWRVDKCQGRLLCVKMARPGPTTVETSSSTVASVEIVTDDISDMITLTIPPETHDLTPSPTPAEVPEIPSLSPSNDDDETDDDGLNIPTASSTEGDKSDDSLLGSVGVLVFMIALACIAVCLVLICAYRLRQKAKAVALQSSQYDKNLYLDRREMDTEGGVK